MVDEYMLSKCFYGVMIFILHEVKCRIHRIIEQRTTSVFNILFEVLYNKQEPPESRDEIMEKLLKAYMKEIADTTKRGDAREESYYGALADLLSNFPLERGRATDVTTLPKKTDAGNPDFRVWDGDHFIVGYIEAKTPGTNLDQIETSEQLERYLNTFPNLILTDFYEFRLYREGQLIDRVTMGRHFTARQLKTTPVVENPDEFEALMSKFLASSCPNPLQRRSWRLIWQSEPVSCATRWWRKNCGMKVRAEGTCLVFIMHLSDT